MGKQTSLFYHLTYFTIRLGIVVKNRVEMAFMNRVASRMMAHRGLTTSAARSVAKAEGEVHPVYAKMKATSKHFQHNDGLKVHQKRPVDKYISAVLQIGAVICLIDSF